MSAPAQRHTGNMNSVSFPIRFNNQREVSSSNELQHTQPQNFTSLADLRISLPPSCDLIEYVRDAPRPFTYNYIPQPLPALHQPSTSTNPSYPVSSPRPVQLSLSDLTPQGSYTLPPTYTLVESAQPPFQRVAMNPLITATSPSTVPSNPRIIPFSHIPISTGTFAHGATPETPSSSGSTTPDIDIDMADVITDDLAAMALDPKPEELIPDFASMRLAPEPMCSYAHCPIQEPHSEGLYLYGDQGFFLKNSFADRIARQVFGASNPPPRVWWALDRLARGEASYQEAVVVRGFQNAHYVAPEMDRMR